MFGVVIPYFQRRAGVLAQALNSVAQQDVDVPVSVVVVDDASPVPAQQEVAQIRFPSNFSVRVIVQNNAGAGGARNRGIDALADARYIAFLDSDDRWEPFHLGSALQAFEHGFDYYTAETEEGRSGFRYMANFFGDSLPLEAAGFAPWAYELTEPLIDFTVAGPISTSSAFVVRNDLIGNTRFDPALRTAGEDGLFRTSLAAKRPRTLVSSRVDVILGEGVNIFTEGGWGGRSATLRSIYFLKSRLLMRPLVRTFPVAKEKVEIAIAKARVELWRSALANLRRGDLPLSEIVQLCILDPRLILSAPRALQTALRGMPA
jgi:succinoglycan biosynthesis protein ExoW